ncbi:MAG TPA: hypothetical protein VL282_08170, partial [Tepidisphaeraceae bacterium]|nr:hypothetical protein [Tepidisphaeraceae bacterium]
DVRLEKHDQQLSPGMTGELAFVLAEKPKALVVPSQAIQDGKVYVIRSGALAEANTKIGLKSIQRTEILSGLEPGERVVISPIGTIKPGQHVGTDLIDPKTAAGLNKEPEQTSSFKGFN